MSWPRPFVLVLLAVVVLNYLSPGGNRDQQTTLSHRGFSRLVPARTPFRAGRGPGTNTALQELQNVSVFRGIYQGWLGPEGPDGPLQCREQNLSPRELVFGSDNAVKGEWDGPAPCAPTYSRLVELRRMAATRGMQRVVNWRKPAVDAVGPELPIPWSKRVMADTANSSSAWSRRMKSGEGLTFYLLEHGPFNFSDVIDCFEASIGMLPGAEAAGVDDFDNYLAPNIAEHLTDLWFLRKLRIHPRRVHDIDIADVKIIGIVGKLSFEAAEMNSAADPSTRMCGGLRDHKRRLERVTEALEALPQYQRFGGQDFLLINTGWRPGDYFGSRLMHMHGVHTTSDLAFGFSMYTLQPKTIVLPYKQHYLLERSAAGIPGAPKRPDDAPNRYPNISHFFHGSIHRINGGRWRGVLEDMAEYAWPEAEINNVEFFKHVTRAADSTYQRHVNESGKALEAAWRMQSEKTVYKSLDAALCLAPQGDSPTSRRPFDALAAGCIPVFFADPEAIIPSLPFPSVVDWENIAIFAGANLTKIYPVIQCLPKLSTRLCLIYADSTLNFHERAVCYGLNTGSLSCHAEVKFVEPNKQGRGAVTTGVEWAYRKRYKVEGGKGDFVFKQQAEWLRNIAASDPAKLKCMAKRGRAAHRRYLSYQLGTVVDGLLAELEARFVWPPVMPQVMWNSVANRWE